jgi:DNA-directed RNA polymerase specialized sigma24 family protein
VKQFRLQPGRKAHGLCWNQRRRRAWCNQQSARRDAALETLCRTYWQPLYSFIRRLGYDTHEAKDLTQDFILHLLTRNPFGSLGPARGKFRSYLLVALRNFLSDDRSKLGAAKRGGGHEILTLDPEVLEAVSIQDQSSGLPADKLFDRRWAWTIVDRAFARLQQEYSAAGKTALFARLACFLSNPGDATQYGAAGAELDLGPGAVSVAVHRMRERYRVLVRSEVAQTVTGPFELEQEMNYLLEVLAS